MYLLYIMLYNFIGKTAIITTFYIFKAILIFRMLPCIPFRNLPTQLICTKTQIIIVNNNTYNFINNNNLQQHLYNNYNINI